MWINVFDKVYVKLNSLVKIEWRKYYPVLVIHERYEKYVKWIAILITLVEQFVEKTLFEYTSLAFRPLPDFNLDRTQWLTNGFIIPTEPDKYPDDLAYIGPSYKDRDFAIKFFSYLRTWSGDATDKDNNVILSFIINLMNSTRLTYTGTSGKEVEQLFIRDAEKKKLEKYGKRQRQYVMQHVFWHTFPFKDGYLIKRFLDFQRPDKPFYLTPSVVSVPGQRPEYLFNYGILKYQYKLRNRNELKGSDIEYHMRPEIM
jgi:hypothetical protein